MDEKEIKQANDISLNKAEEDVLQDSFIRTTSVHEKFP